MCVHAHIHDGSSNTETHMLKFDSIKIIYVLCAAHRTGGTDSVCVIHNSILMRSQTIALLKTYTHIRQNA